MKQSLLFLLLPLHLAAQTVFPVPALIKAQMKPCMGSSALLLGFKDTSGRYCSMLVTIPQQGDTKNNTVSCLAIPDGNRMVYCGVDYVDTSCYFHFDSADSRFGDTVANYQTSWKLKAFSSRAKAELIQKWKPAIELKAPDNYSWNSNEVWDFTWIENGCASVTLGGGDYTGGAHPNWYDDYLCVRVSQLLKNNLNCYDTTLRRQDFPGRELFERQRHAAIRSLLYKSSSALQYYIDDLNPDVYYRNLQMEIDSMEFFGASDGPIDTNNIYFRLEHACGETHLLALADVDACYALSGDYEHTAGTDLGVPGKKLPFRFDSLAAEMERHGVLLDVLIAPGDDKYGLVVHGHENNYLLLFRSGDANAIATIPIPKTLLMAEWANGDQAGAWEKELTR